MSETPQERIQRWLAVEPSPDAVMWTPGVVREAIRAVLELVDVQYRVNEELGRDLEQTEGVARGYMLAAEKAEAERDALRSTVHGLSVQLEEGGKEERALREIMRRLVHGIDEWNSAVTPIIGRPVGYKWPALEEARDVLAPEVKP